MTNNFCINCDQKVPIWIRHRRVKFPNGPVQITYEEAYAICQYCGEEIYDRKVNDRNVNARAFAIEEEIRVRERLKGENK